MRAAIDRLTALRVRDLMQRVVVTVSANHSMAEAARVLLDHEVSGAPVVDETGRCVGMLSAHDFVRREWVQGRDEAGSSQTPHAVEQERPGEPLWILAASDQVRAHMTPVVQEIAPHASLVAAGRVMCSMHIHRLPVLGAGGAPVGIVTSLDIVAALVGAMEEAP
jgi:CBS domain-containing protein